MPEVLALIPVIVGAVGAGTGLYSALNQPGTPKVTPATPQPQTAATNEAQRASVSQALPTLQALTGGSLSPEYATQYGATQSGLENNPAAAGNIQAAINAFFGLSAPGQTGLTPSTSSSTGAGGTSTIDLLNRATPLRSPTTGGGGGGLVDSLLAGDEFRGLAA